MVGITTQTQTKSAAKAIKEAPVTIEDDFCAKDYSQRKNSRLWQLTYIPVGVILILLFLVVLLPLLDQVDLRTQYLLNKQLSSLQEKCSFEVVESIPEGMVYPNSSFKNPSTFETWMKLIQSAEHTIEIASFYWTLSKWEKFPNESRQGDEVFNALLKAGLERNITIKIAQSKPSKSMPNNDTEIMIAKKAAQVKTLDFDAFLGTGVLHTKFWIIDRKHLYIGSANTDWRALTQVKELGIAMYNCSAVAQDLAKIFEVYWTLGNQTSLPTKWPDSLSTVYNAKNPFSLLLNGQKNSLYLSSSPPQLSPKGRNDDLYAVLEIIKNAKSFIHISVMNYLPLVLYSKQLKYWPAIDNELRKAVVDRNVKVRLLTSLWPSTRPMEFNFLRSLTALNKFRKSAFVEVKLFKVPSTPSQSGIPHARVNHNKYMVTDNGAFIGTSNWSGDYFISTAGVSVVSPCINGTANAIQERLVEIFDRDWNSTYAEKLTNRFVEIPRPKPVFSDSSFPPLIDEIY